MRSRRSWPMSTRLSTQAASEALKVEHITNRSPARQVRVRPLSRFWA